MMRTRARMQIVASDRAGLGNVPGHIHFTERPNKPPVQVRWASAWDCPILKDPAVSCERHCRG